MKKHLAALCALVCVASITGCNGSEFISPAPVMVSGTWTRLDEPPGSGEQWMLSLNGSTISGDGSWTGEACCAGTLSISGRTSSDSLHLDVAYLPTSPQVRPTFHLHFDGGLSSPTLMQGMASDDGQSAVPVRLQKVIPR
jgi:hypothetical protein